MTVEALFEAADSERVRPSADVRLHAAMEQGQYQCSIRPELFDVIEVGAHTLD